MKNLKVFKVFQNFRMAALIVCLFASGVNADISISWGIPGTYKPFDPCPGVTPGGTWLDDIGYMPADPLNAWPIDALEWHFSGPNIYTKDGVEFRPENKRWSFSWGNPLNGELFIDKYEAYDKHHNFDPEGNIVWDISGSYCRHGSHLSASYFRDPIADPLDVYWTQIFVASYDKHGIPAGIPIVDPFYNDGTDDAPFYFSNLDDPFDYYKETNHGQILFLATRQAPRI